MQKVTIIFGNITFEENKKAIVHEIHGIVKIDKSKADEFGDENVNYFDGYVIPEIWDGEVIYECETIIKP